MVLVCYNVFGLFVQRPSWSVEGEQGIETACMNMHMYHLFRITEYILIVPYATIYCPFSITCFTNKHTCNLLKQTNVGTHQHHSSCRSNKAHMYNCSHWCHLCMFLHFDMVLVRIHLCLCEKHAMAILRALPCSCTGNHWKIYTYLRNEYTCKNKKITCIWFLHWNLQKQQTDRYAHRYTH